MVILLFVLIGVCIVLVGVVLYLLQTKTHAQNQQVDTTLLAWMKSMQNSMDITQKTIHDSLHANSSQMIQTLQENSKQLHERLDRAAAVMRDVNIEVGKMSQIGRNMQELQEFLKSPKLRGNIGEQVLKDLLSQVFPKNNFHLQYTFRTGDKVDAAIQTDAGILPIDSKFPMENFQKFIKAQTDSEKDIYKKEFSRDVKRHIETIAKKYILPDEGTMDFALMYVPSESVFYEIVNTDDIVAHAKANRIFIVSPSTLYAHLQTILLSFEGKRIEQRSKEVFQILRGLQVDYEKVTDSLDILGKHINNASGQFVNVTKGFLQFGNKLSSVKHLGDSEEKLPKEN